jgi:predicted nucleotidyltransferase
MLKNICREKNLLKKIAQKYSIELLLLFGSRVSGKIHRESDFDIGYLSKRTLSVEEEGQLMLGLAQVLKIPLERMELVSLRGASPLFLKEVFNNSLIIFAKDELIFDRYKIYSLRYFEEFQPIFEQMAKIFKKRIEKYKKELSLKK